MALFDDIIKGNLATGIVLGLGGLILAPIALPVVATIAKPLAKAAIKGGLIMLEKTKETVAEMSEVAEDLVAEARAELKDATELSGAGEAVLNTTATVPEGGEEKSGS